MCPPQKRQKHNQHLKLLFSKENLRFGTSEQISVCRKLDLLAIITQGIVQNQDLRPWDLRPGIPGPWDPGPWDPETRNSGSREPEALGPWNTGPWQPGPLNWDSGKWDPDTQDPGNRSLGIGNCYSETQNPESRTLRIELVTQIPSILTRTTAWINFNCEANFDNKKLGHLSQKLYSVTGVDGPKH